jgi:hypothetical protein
MPELLEELSNKVLASNGNVSEMNPAPCEVGPQHGGCGPVGIVETKPGMLKLAWTFPSFFVEAV